MPTSAPKAFLLAAGLGTRLRPLTDHTPKCLIPIQGVPLLQIWFTLLEKAGVHDVLLNTHWLPERVNEFVAKYSGPLRISTFFEPELLGSAGTIAANLDWIGSAEEILILYADNLTTVDLGEMVRFHRSHPQPFTLGVFHAAEPRRCGIVTTDADGIVQEFIEKPQHPKSDLAAGGIYVADTTLVRGWRPTARPFDLGTSVLPLLAGKMKVKLLDGILLDVGTPESYAQAQKVVTRESLG